MTTQKSLAATEQQYLLARGKIVGTTLHLQVEGHPGNRSYGYSIDLPVPGGAAAWFDEGVPMTLPSFNDAAGATYGEAQVRPDHHGSGRVKIQIKGPLYNRGYGATFEFEGCLAFREWLLAELGVQVGDIPKAIGGEPTPDEEPEA